ncbi:MAG: YraN family protein [Comamonas sp.]|jgi:putative endonuclease|nr:YraN family protein [Comamonas sp.]
MDFLGKQPNTTARGQLGEDAALAYLQRQGLKLVERNYRTPGRGGGEIDLILRDRDGSLVFVEVRSRNTGRYGGAGGSISSVKQGRIVLAARHYLTRFVAPPPCRFDVVLLEGAELQWLKAAFDAQ